MSHYLAEFSKSIMIKTQIFCDRFFDRMNKITELGGLVWADRMTGFFRTYHAGFRYAKGAGSKIKTLTSRLAEVLFFPC